MSFRGSVPAPCRPAAEYAASCGFETGCVSAYTFTRTSTAVLPAQSRDAEPAPVSHDWILYSARVVCPPIDRAPGESASPSSGREARAGHRDKGLMKRERAGGNARGYTRNLIVRLACKDKLARWLAHGRTEHGSDG